MRWSMWPNCLPICPCNFVISSKVSHAISSSSLRWGETSCRQWGAVVTSVLYLQVSSKQTNLILLEYVRLIEILLWIPQLQSRYISSMLLVSCSYELKDFAVYDWNLYLWKGTARSASQTSRQDRRLAAESSSWAAPLVPSLLGTAPTFGLPPFIANKFLY